MIPFFITGFPRCRTTWFANFLTTDKSFCYHDMLKDVMNEDGINKEFQESARKYPNIEFWGDSDSGLLLHLEKVSKLYKDSKWVIVTRNKEECKDSYFDYFKEKSYPGAPKNKTEILRLFDILDEFYKKALKCLPPENLFDVGFYDLDNVSVIRNIWEFCLPTITFPEKRWRLLNTFRINIIPYKITMKGII